MVNIVAKMGHDIFYELTRRSVPLIKNIGTKISWRESVLSVRTDKGVNVFDFSYNLECLDKDIDVFEVFVPSPKDSPADELCKSQFINNGMKNYDFTEMIIDSSFWPHNSTLTEEMTHVNMTAWSPPNFIENRSVFTTLNNIGGVVMHIQQQHHWKNILSLSPYIKNSLEYNKMPKKFEELKKSVYIVETCSICWAPNLNSDSSCYLVTAQKDDTILFWRIFNNNQSPIIKGKIQSSMTEIINMIWIPRTKTMFWLICADIFGQVNVFIIQIKNGNFNLLDSHIIWKYKDRMIASNLQYMIINENIVLFYSKHRHFVVQVLDTNCKNVSEYIKNVNDYRITDIVSSLSGYYMCTINVKIYKLSISLSEHTINVDLSPVELKDPYSTYELYSLCFSHNNTLCVLGMVDRKLLCRKEVLKIDVIFISTESMLNSIIPLIFNNPSKKLTNYWDCIEALRCNINKMRAMPVIDWQTLYREGSNDIYKLKIYFVLLTFYLNMQKIARISANDTIPELSVDAVKEKILLLHAQTILKKLYEKKKYDTLDKQQKESLFGCVSYLQYYSKVNKTEIMIDNETLKFVKKSKFQYVCQSCDSLVTEGFTCNSGHLNMYCMLSLTQITGDDYLVCKCCGTTARTDLGIDNPLCVFCDQQLFNPD